MTAGTASTHEANQRFERRGAEPAFHRFSGNGASG
jgi:hypothetical protein